MRNLENWLVQNLRLTVFTHETTIIPEAPNWWNEITGETPEKRISTPREHSFREEGNKDNGLLFLNITGGRIDWSWNAIIDPNKEIDGYPAIGKFIDTSSKFQSWMVKWLANVPASTRFAFGGVFVLPVSDRKTGYAEIARFLPSIELDPDSREFQYSINRPRLSTSGIPDLEINRLSKWSIAALRKMMMDPGTEKGQVLAEFNSCRVELDINTSADYGEVISGTKVNEVYLELVSLGEEILESGDNK